MSWCTSVLVMERRESPELRTVLIPLRPSGLCPGGSTDRLLGAGAKCGKAVCSWISHFTHLLLLFLTSFFPLILSSLEQIHLGGFRCCLLRLTEAAMTGVS